MKTFVVFSLVLTTLLCAMGQSFPDGFLMPASTRAPDGQYGVLVPVLDEQNTRSLVEQGSADKLIEVRTGRVLAEMQGGIGYNRPLRYNEVLLSRWSADNSLLVWEVADKWFPSALDVLRLEAGRVEWQVDLLTIAQKLVLDRTKVASPKRYALAKQRNANNGAAYPEGFTVDVEVVQPIKLPLHVQVSLTEDPKHAGHHPVLESHLEGLVTRQGTFVVTDFNLGPGPKIIHPARCKPDF